MQMSRATCLPCVAFILIGLIACPATVLAECALNCLQACGQVCSRFQSASFRTSSCHGTPGASGSYNLRTGRLVSSARLNCSDQFVVERTPNGAPTILRLLIHFHGEGYRSHAGFGVTIPNVGQVADQEFFGDRLPPNYLTLIVDHDYTLDVMVTPGSTFDVNSEATGTEQFGLDGSSETTLTYGFQTPASGTLVRSCQGMVVDTYSVTPTRRESWGSVKAHYR